MSAIAYVPGIAHPEPSTLPESPNSDGANAADYDGGTPTWTPLTSGAHTVDTSNGAIWWYYGGAWHEQV